MDTYVKAYIKLHVHIDAGNRVFCKGEELPVYMIGGLRKVTLPPTVSKLTYTFDDLKRAGCKCDTVTMRTLALAGAEGRWKDNIEQRRKDGLPSNVYIANARSIQYALDQGKTPPAMKFVGRVRDQITEARDTVDEVVDDIANSRYRTEFSRGRNAKRKS